jgi:hypothetical protein
MRQKPESQKMNREELMKKLEDSAMVIVFSVLAVFVWAIVLPLVRLWDTLADFVLILCGDDPGQP